MSDRPTNDDFVIAALGASAGGLEPLEAFFRLMPADSGIAFVIIQHLAPDHPTALPQLLARHTEMPVEQAQDNTQVVPNRVYVIPPNATLTIEKGTLGVKEPAEARGVRTPIDSFFSSLAEDRGEHAVCIMLSGTGTDGTLGLRAIKEYGGMAMAQTLDSAKYDAILRSAIATGLVDHVLPVEEMPAKLLNYAAYLVSANGKGTTDSVREQIAAHMSRVHAILRRRAGHDFSQYKENTIARRLERRMKALQIETVEQYAQTLERQPGEADRLFNDLLIGVTQFFRDAASFEALQTEVIPKLFENKGEGDQVRVCVMGCATGEEAYSIAILLSEYASTLATAPKIQIFATDIDEGALATARKGRYPESVAEHIAPERLERFFDRQDSAWQVKRELREIVLFSSHSFIKDPPFSRLDLISCRNVMIYLGQELQRKLIPLFHYALRPGGYLFLGPSESATSHKELFGTVDKKHRIFERKETLPRPVVTFPLAEVSRPNHPGVTSRKPPEAADDRDLPKRLERIILQRYRPACVTVKENGDAVYFSGQLSRYLEHPTGSPDVNVVNMAREGLRIPLRTALHRAVTAGERVVQKQISVQMNGGFSQIDLTVEPIAEFQAANLYMVVFEDAPSSAASPQHAAPAADANSEETIRHLEDELRSARENAQAMFEELESSNEELKSANEEYQSANEELETSQEELQSFNEELQTVNTEISRKSAELDHANSDLQNLLNSTEIATIFLDGELRIKAFTPAAGAVFRLIASDAGRPITDLAAQFADVDLVSDIRETLRTLKGRERELAGTGGRFYQLRVLPYRTVKNVIDGVVLTFTEVTQAKQAMLLVEDAKTYAENIVDTVRVPLLVLDAQARVKSANLAFYEMFQVTAAETLNTPIYRLGDGQWDIPELRRLLGDTKKQKIEDFEVEHDFPAIGRKTFLLDARQIRQHSDSEPLILLTIEDITGRRRAEEMQARLSAIVTSSTDAILSKTLEGIITTWNAGAERMFGYTAEEMIGQSNLRLIPPELHHEEDLILGRIRAGERIEHYETVRLTKNGHLVPVSLTISPLKDATGKIIGASKIAHDITDRKRLEDIERQRALQFESLFKEAPLGVYVVDADFRVNLVNPTALPVFGDIPGLIGMDFDALVRILWPKAYADEILKRFRHTLETGEPYNVPERGEERLDRGVAEYYQWHINRIQLPDERYGVVCYFWDISAQVLARAAIAESREELRRVNEDLKHFSYASSHDLQEPLRMVTSYTQLLAREYKGRLDPKADQFISHAVDGAKRMESLLTDLREFWSVHEQKVEHLAPVDLNRVLETALASLEIPLLETGALVTHDPLPTIIMEELPPVLLFQNLIGNAIKYRRPETAPRIHISAQEDGDHWRITVTDNGMGIEAEYLKTIFAPFKRLHGREVPGTGMGLAICKKIVERYGGRIWVESTYGQGSAFHFTLPVHRGGV